ncbi:MAG: DUF1489 family protein [Hyphomicrobiales bacterium]|nr:DUF1489 family protein [Hyphomicrobiales bacterium]MDE2114900.1 DUF1489 domain-containing protein [Hyphomicrobiales bacterium]
MTLNLLKLCVGASAISDLENWIASRLALAQAEGRPVEQFHTTRMVPKRADELLDGGSLYWVIKGQIAVRQRLLQIRPHTDKDGIGRCDLVLEPVLIPVYPLPCRPFQGWRYLKSAEAPRDLNDGAENVADLPESLRRELREMGLL